MYAHIQICTYNFNEGESEMAKDLGEIKFSETDDGLRIDIKGKELKEMFSCCIPIFGGKAGFKADCCQPEGKEEN